MPTAVKPEPSDPAGDPAGEPLDLVEGLSDETVFSSLQGSIEACQDELKGLRKRLRPIKKRLVQRMEDEGLPTLTCGQFVLTSADDEEETGVAVTMKRLEEFLTEEQMDEYCEENKRPPKKRRVKCERLIVEVEDDE